MEIEETKEKVPKEKQDQATDKELNEMKINDLS